MKAALAMLVNASVSIVKILSNVLSEKLLPILRNVTPLSNVLSEKLLPIMSSA